MGDASVALIVLATAVALFVWNRLPIAVVALGVALALYATDVLSLEESLAGFGDPTVLFIASLFVISEALDAGGVTTWAGQRLVSAARSDPTRLIVFVLLLCAVLSAVITPNGAVAALLPMMVAIATRIGRSTAKLLMPLAFQCARGITAGAMFVLPPCGDIGGPPHADPWFSTRPVELQSLCPMGSGDTGAPLAEKGLRQLLEVGRALVADLDLESVLQHVLETARELTGARYAALGILDERKEGLERFLFLGIDEATRRLIGPFPRGRGVLGELIRRPEPLRLHDVTQHPRSYGFPPGHPPMTSFLGVPIVIRGEAFGNLYLTDKAHGDFDDGDEHALVILAEWAAIAIDNARLYQNVARRRRELERVVRGLEATATIARAVGFETDLERVLELIVKRGLALIDARSLVVLLEQSDGSLKVVATAGESADEARVVVVAGEGTLAGSVLAAGAAERVPSLGDRKGHGLEAVVGSATSAIVVPLGFRGRARGVLVALDRAVGSPIFDADDEHLLTSFGASAAIAIATAESVEAERLRHSIRASEAERQRWARELHDETLQELGGLKVLLESARVSNRPEVLEGAVGKAVEQLELSIGGLQALITELRPAALDQLGVKPALEALISRTAATSGLEISARIELASIGGSEATRLSGEIESTIYRLVQEALTNVVKHAEANRAWVEVSEDEQEVTVTVRDDGTGFDPDQPAVGFGLVGMRERAELVNGRLLIDSSAEQGTTVRVVLPAERDGSARQRELVSERRAVT